MALETNDLWRFEKLNLLFINPETTKRSLARQRCFLRRRVGGLLPVKLLVPLSLKYGLKITYHSVFTFCDIKLHFFFSRHWGEVRCGSKLAKSWIRIRSILFCCTGCIARTRNAAGFALPKPSSPPKQLPQSKVRENIPRIVIWLFCTVMRILMNYETDPGSGNFPYWYESKGKVLISIFPLKIQVFK